MDDLLVDAISEVLPDLQEIIVRKYRLILDSCVVFQ